MWARLRRAREYVEAAVEAPSTVTPRAASSLARDVVLVATDPETGKVWDDIAPMVSAALFVELVHEGRLAVTGEGRKVRVTVSDRAPLGDEVLDDVLLSVGTGVFGQRVRTLMSFTPTGREVIGQLVAAGSLVAERQRLLGALPVRRYRVTHAAGRDALVARVRGVLLDGSVPDERTALLVCVLDLAMPLKRVVGKAGAKEADRRAKQLRAGLGAEEQAVLSAVTAAMQSAS